MPSSSPEPPSDLADIERAEQDVRVLRLAFRDKQQAEQIRRQKSRQANGNSDSQMMRPFGRKNLSRRYWLGHRSGSQLFLLTGSWLLDGGGADWISGFGRA